MMRSKTFTLLLPLFFLFLSPLSAQKLGLKIGMNVGGSRLFHNTDYQSTVVNDLFQYTQELFKKEGFDYTWEVYTKPEKRMRGYYALPILAGSSIVGHVDPKADRPGKTLEVMGSAVARGHKVAPALDALARFLGLDRAKRATR